jgi:predicted RNA-binding protein with PIN domain
MNIEWLIIDGNNLLHQMPELRDLVRHDFDGARAALVRQFEPLVGSLANRITIVFDGRLPGQPPPPRLDRTPAPACVEIIFSPAHLTADSLIERFVEQADNSGKIVVVSSDLAERQNVEATGAYTLSCRTFLESLARMRTDRAPSLPTQRSTLGDFFPPPSGSE